MKASAQLLLVTRRAKKNSGKYPAKIRVIYQRNSKDYLVGMDLTQDEFNGATCQHIKKQYRTIANKLNEKKN